MWDGTIRRETPPFKVNSHDVLSVEDGINASSGRRYEDVHQTELLRSSRACVKSRGPFLPVIYRVTGTRHQLHFLTLK